MAQPKNPIDEFIESLRALSVYDISDFSAPNPRNASFRDVLHIVKFFQELAGQLLKVNGTLYEEHPSFNGIVKFFEKINQALPKMTNHIINPSSADSNGPIHREELKGLYKEFMNNYITITSLIPIENKSEYVEGIEANFKESMNLFKQMEQKRDEINELHKKINEKAVQEDVSRFANRFEDNSKKYKESSNRWLGSAVFLLVLTICALIFSECIFGTVEKDSTFELAKFLSSKLISLTLLISATLWCAKMFKVNSNLSVIYQHKSDSLSTFTEFVNSAHADVIKDQVLYETTKTVFNLPETGLISHDNLPVQSFSKIVDLLKNTKTPG